MLQHDQNQADVSPAADVRVTAGELANALASLQARQEGTIALGEAIRELNLDATPEEPLAEVEAQRAQTGTAKQRLSVGRRRARLIASTGALLLLSGIVTLGTVTATSPPALLPEIVQETSLSFQQKVLVRDQTAQGPLVRTLAEVPEGRTVRASANAVQEAAMYRLPHRGQIVLSSQAEPYLTWPVVKLGGEIYVRGWVRERLSDEAARLAIVELYNTPDAPALGSHPVPITLRLTPNMFGAGRSYERQPDAGIECFFFANLRPNKYAWTKW